MLRPRVIPCLLLKAGQLVKTVRFGDPKYVGDPLNAVRIFNEKEVDELFVADIDASAQRREPDLRLIAAMANECRMPLCYAGGIRAPEQVEQVISLGVEKVGVSSAALESSGLVREAARRVGSQSIVGILDVRRAGPDAYNLFTHNGARSTGLRLADAMRQLQDDGVGEVVVNSIDRDGTQEGYDLELVAHASRLAAVPLTVLGGAGSLQDLKDVFAVGGVSGTAAGSFFVFKGRFRAVLISYPSRSARDSLLLQPPVHA